MRAATVAAIDFFCKDNLTEAAFKDDEQAGAVPDRRIV
jgi:hypothetical protein